MSPLLRVPRVRCHRLALRSAYPGGGEGRKGRRERPQSRRLLCHGWSWGWAVGMGDSKLLGRGIWLSAGDLPRREGIGG